MSKCTDRVVLVDEDAVRLREMGRTFREEGYGRVCTVDDPRLAVEVCRERAPDLVVLALHTAREDLLALVGALAAEVPAPPVLAVAPANDPSLRVRALRLGAGDLVTRPVDTAELLLRAANLVESAQLRTALRRHGEHLERTVGQRTAELRQTQHEIVRRLGRAGELRDSETGQHVVRIGQASRALARAIGWSADACALVEDASTLHDIGKIGIPDEILLKPGPLTPAERKTMERHTLIGAEILEGVDSPLLVMAREIALGHHERWDGGGYPYGVAGTRIPTAARIVAVVDVFDALVMDRPYKRAWPVEQALDHLWENRGRHFDAALVEAWIPIVEDVLQTWQAPRAAIAK